MSNIILCNLSDANSIIDEERLYWVFDVLDYIGIPEEVYESKTIDEFRHSMDQYGIDVELSTNGEVRIYKKEWFNGKLVSDWLPATDDQLIGHWKEPTRIIKINGREYYYEIHLNEWSILNMRRKK
jgi:hypothetical protein